MKSMNSRERLLTVFNGGIPDRVPVSCLYMVGWRKDDWHNRKESYSGLMDFIREKADCIYHIYYGELVNGFTGKNRLLTASEEVVEEAEKFEKDGDTYENLKLATPGGILDMSIRYNDRVNTVWDTEFFIKDTDDVEKIISTDYKPIKPNPGLKKAYGEVGDKGVVMIDIFTPFGLASQLMEFQDFLMMAALEPELMGRLLDCLFDRVWDLTANVLENYDCDIIRLLGEESACPPFLPPSLYREYNVSYDRMLIDLIHKHKKLARIHCHGRIRNVLDCLLDTGVDMIDPVEGPADGDISIKEVKKICGNRLCLLGNIEERDMETLPADAIREKTKRLLADAMPGGRFVAEPSDSPIGDILDKRTEENYIAFVETAREYGKY